MTTLAVNEVPVRFALRKVVERVANWVRPGPVVLMYHRIADVGVDPFSNAVSPDHFAEHLQVLRRYCEPIPLQTMVRLHHERRLPARAVSISFDDGYVDNLHNAKPLCVRYDVPGTVFVATGMTGLAREFYWDELERIFLCPGTLPTELTLRIGGQDCHWSLGEDAAYGAKAFQRHRVYRFEDAAPTRRHAMYVELHNLLSSLADAERQSVLEMLRSWAKLLPSKRRLAHPMTADEICTLSDGGLMEVGAHSVGHRLLPGLSGDEMDKEIRGSKRCLENILGESVKGFAYPHGRFDDRSAQIVRDSGYAYACSTLNKPIRVSADSYALPRIMVKDWDGEQFARRLSRYMHGVG